MATYYSDLHCHSTLFNYNRQLKDTWDEEVNLIFPSQGDFSKLARGDLRVVMVALYPIERGFVTAKQLALGTGNITDFLAEVIIDMPKDRADEIQDDDHDYFEDLRKELNFLQLSADPVTKKVRIAPLKRKNFRYKIVHDFTDLKNLLNLDANLNPGAGCDDTIAVVLTIEGANALGIGQKNTENLDFFTLKNKLLVNIAKLKELGPPGQEGAWSPFFITLSHHFWNQLGGHAVSLWKVIRKVMDQTQGISSDITPLGEVVVDALLDNTNGKRRILIDITHMSIKMRRWYYNHITAMGGNIPIIASHTGVTGIPTMDLLEMKAPPGKSIHDYADELYDSSTKFNTWDQFLSDEEIMIIFNSGGIIGLNMDHRIMMGKKTLEETKKLAMLKSAEKERAIWIQPLLNQILYIARYILSKTNQPAVIWDNISIGSDYSGMITPIKAFNNASDFPELDKTMFRGLNKLVATEPILYGKTEADIREIKDKIMWKNNLNFLEKHFVS